MTAPRSPCLDLQTAICDRIAADHPTYKLYRYLPDTNPAYPHAVFGSIDATPDETKTSNGWHVTFTIEIYSKSPSIAEIDGILGGFIGSLCDPDAPLEVANDWHLSVAVDGSFTIATEAGDQKQVNQHGILRLSIWVEDDS